MEDIKACRICLVIDVKMYNLRSYPLETYFESIIGINPFSGMDLPSYACFECASLAKKYYLFRERCLRGQAALYGILHTSGKITFEDIKQVDRQKSNLTSNLKIQRIVDEGVHNYSFDETNVNIKEEDLQSTESFKTVSIKQEVCEEDLKNTETFDTVSVKQEQYDDFPQLTMSSDDDEPLSLHKTDKDKKPEKERVMRTKTSEEFCREIIPQQLQDIEVTFEDIKQVDRQNSNLTSNLKIQRVVDEGVHNYSFDETNITIKEEDLQSTVSFETISIKQEEYDEDLRSIESFDTVSIKQEDYDDFPHFPQSSDDDEPLSLHRSIKEKKSEKETVRRMKTSEEFCREITSQQLQDIEVTDDIHSEITNVEKRQGDRGRQRKTESAMNEMKTEKCRRMKNILCGVGAEEDIDLEEYVTIIKLTVDEQIEEITKRQMSSNYLNAIYQCNLCYKGFVNTHAWQHHLGKHDPKSGDIECPICKFRFKTKRLLQQHAANHDKKYACKSCPHISKTTTQAKHHQRWHKGVTYKCQHCDEVSTKWTSHFSHVRNKHPSEFICGVCGYSFVSKLGLTMHKSMMHKDVADTTEMEGDSEQSAPYCSQCDVHFVSSEAWKRHMVTSAKHTQSTHFNNGCRVCGETFKNAEELRVHHRKKHARKPPKKPSDMWPAKCEHCSEVIQNGRDYWVHFRREHPDKKYRRIPIQKNYVCDICGKSFINNAILVYHKRTHTSERAYKCVQCPKTFFNRNNLLMHEKTHSDHRPYPCNVCTKAFKRKEALDRHSRSHTGVKPYVCEECGKAFSQSHSRKAHVLTVHLKQPMPYVRRNGDGRRNSRQNH